MYYYIISIAKCGGGGGEGFGLYQSCENRGNVGSVSVFGLQWYGGVGSAFGSGSGGVR